MPEGNLPAKNAAMTVNLRWLTLIVASCLAAAASTTAFTQRDDKSASSRDEETRRPKLTLRAQPAVSMSPSRVTLTADLVGGANDYEDFYCPTVLWEWGDGTQSESTLDCEPYQVGKSAIKRRFTAAHIFRAGEFRVMIRLKRHEKSLASAGANVRVQAGLTDIG